MASFNSRNGLMDFSGSGASMNCGKDLLNKPTGGVGSFSFASWVYIDQWVQNSYVFRKYESATKNIDLQLGAAATNQLVFHLSNGADNYVTADNSGISAGGWHHVAVTYSGTAAAYQQVKIYVDGVSVPVSYKNGDGLVSTSSSFSQANFELGVNFDGKLDETVVSLLSLSSNEINNIMNSPIVVDSWNETKTCGYWKYDDVLKPGKDSRTWVSVLDGLKQTLNGYDGAQIRLGLSGGDWKTMMASSTARTNFANKVKNIVETYGFDGVDLDFEWCLTTQEWSDYSATILVMNSVFPSSFNFSVSLHPYFYNISSAAILALDHISIQAYGGSPSEFSYATFVNNVSAMLNYGYPAQKLVMGLPFYGVTTDNTKVETSYRNIVSQYPTLDPSINQISVNLPPIKDITFNGQQTIIAKTKYVSDQSLAGVMYWDTATDVDYTNQLSLLRALNTVMNANVITEGGLTGRNVSNVKFENSTNVTNEVSSNVLVYPNPAKNVFTIELPVEKEGCIKIYSLNGQEIFTQILNQDKVNLNAKDFKPGVYIVKFYDKKGNSKSSKLIIQ
jgi:hypothetical protein